MSQCLRCALAVTSTLLLLLLLLLGCSSPDARDAEGNLRAEWTRLGVMRSTAATLGASGGYHEITVRSDLGAYERIQLYFDEYAVHLRDVTVHYTDGTAERFMFRTTYPAGSHSHVLRLAGFPRGIDRVALSYQAAEQTEQPNADTDTDTADPAERQVARIAVYGRN